MSRPLVASLRTAKRLEHLPTDEKKQKQEQRAGRVWRKQTKVKLTEQEKTDELREWIASN